MDRVGVIVLSFVINLRYQVPKPAISTGLQTHLHLWIARLCLQVELRYYMIIKLSQYSKLAGALANQHQDNSNADTSTR